MSWIQTVHELPGRTRLLSPVLRRNETRCEQLADALAATQGIREVRVRPYTGSVLVEHDRELSANAIVEAAARVLDVAVLQPGMPPPLADQVPAFSSVAQHLVHVFRDLDRDIRRKSDGTVDLGTLVTLGLVGAGAAKVVASRTLPAPPWFNLAWWGVRTFVSSEHEEIEADRSQEAAANHSS